jgi:type IV pilus assembly protein PilF
MRRAGVIGLLALLFGCVTETTGGRTEAASREARVEAQINLARGYLESDNRIRAREPLERALELNPRSAEALGLFGVLYQGENEPELAERYYRRALRADSRHAQTLNNYGVFLFNQGRYQDALAQFRVLVRDTSYRSRDLAFENLGLTELRVGNRPEARAAFTRALSINSDLPVSHLELADLLHRAGEHRAALSHYERFRTLARQVPRSLCLGISLAEALGDYDQRASYEIALRNLYPDSPEARQCPHDG